MGCWPPGRGCLSLLPLTSETCGRNPRLQGLDGTCPWGRASSLRWCSGPGAAAPGRASSGESDSTEGPVSGRPGPRRGQQGREGRAVQPVWGRHPSSGTRMAGRTPGGDCEVASAKDPAQGPPLAASWGECHKTRFVLGAGRASQSWQPGPWSLSPGTLGPPQSRVSPAAWGGHWTTRTQAHSTPETWRRAWGS